MTAPVVVLFCRAPVPGLTKTRLSPPLDPAAGAALSLAMLLDAAEALQATGHDVEARVASEFDEGPVRALLDGLRVEPQGPGDLGARMARAADSALAAGRSAAVIVGSDCPGLTPRHVEGALGALGAGADAAICPSSDGGYGLIALRRSCPALFRDMPWSTSSVLAASRVAAAGAGLHLAETESLDDVDRPEDLEGLDAKLAAGGVAPRTRHALRALGVAG